MDKKALFAGILAVVLWGTVFVFGQIAVQAGFHPLLVAFIRFVSASIFLFLYHIANKGKLFLQKKDVPDFLLLGVTGIAGMNICIFYSLRLTDSTITSLLMSTNGFIIGILGFFLLKEKIGILELIGLFVGIAGCWLIFTQGDFSRISQSNLEGNLLAVCASFCWAFYSVWGKKAGVIEKYGAILSTFWAAVFGSIMLAIVIFLLRISAVFYLKGILISVYLGVVPAGIGFALWFYSIKRLKTVVPGIIQFLTPLITALLAIVLLKQSISSQTILGGILIVAGILFPLKSQK